MNGADRVLAALDAAGQASSEHGYGLVVADGYCVRCGLQAMVGGDLCPGCRAFLLEDIDVDPRYASTPSPGWASGGWDLETVRDAVRAFLGACAEYVQSVLDAFAAFGAALTEACVAIGDLIEQARELELLSPARARELELLERRRREQRRGGRWGSTPGRKPGRR